MKHIKIIQIITSILLVSFFFISCEKDKTLPQSETFKLNGKIDPIRTNVTTAALTNAEFTIVYNSPNSFGEAQSLFNGSFSITGYQGFTASGGVADTLSFFSSQSSGPILSFITVPTATFNSTTTTKLYTYNNSSNAAFSAISFPFTNELTLALKEGKGFFRLGKAPRYVFINLDMVTKL